MTAKRWRLVAYHPTRGEDWSHYDTYYEAVVARAKRLAHSPEVHYQIKEVE